MREYEGYEDLAGYEDVGYYDDDGEAEEEENEQEEDPKLTQEQLEYLELRKKLKELHRKRLKKENGSDANSVDSRKDNFGSFFGPSQPVIAQRVIQESKSLLENQHLVSRILNPGQRNKNVSNQTSVGSRPQSHNMPKADPIKVQVQKLKVSRDYSFLLNDDAQPPAPRREPPLRKISAPNPGAISSGAGSERLAAEMGKSSMKKPGSAPVTKSSMSGLQRPNLPPAPRTNLQTVKYPVTQKKVMYEPYKPERGAKQQATSANAPTNGHMSKPSNKLVKPISARPHAQGLKKRPLPRLSDEEDDSGFDYRSEIRNLFRYDPKKFQDDDDTSDMEASFDEVMKEERRSALIARKEDEIQQKLIEEEERRERMRKEAKKQKLGER